MLDTSTMDRRVFREMLLGGYTFNWRRTWILYQSDRRARLDVICQMSLDYIGPTPATSSGSAPKEPVPMRPMGITGKEADDGAWKEPSVTHYAGTRDEKGSYHMTLTSGTPGKNECSWMPDVVDLSCREESIAVLRAGALLILDNASAGLFHWAPSTPSRVAGLRCEGLTNPRFHWPLMFVAPKTGAPGVEYAFLHDDAVQQGAYRWMPSPK